MTDNLNLFDLLMKWCARDGKYAFKVEFGYGVCEVPFIELFADMKLVWSGTYSEFLKMVSEQPSFP